MNSSHLKSFLSYIKRPKTPTGLQDHIYPLVFALTCQERCKADDSVRQLLGWEMKPTTKSINLHKSDMNNHCNPARDFNQRPSQKKGARSITILLLGADHMPRWCSSEQAEWNDGKFNTSRWDSPFLKILLSRWVVYNALFRQCPKAEQCCLSDPLDSSCLTSAVQSFGVQFM